MREKLAKRLSYLYTGELMAIIVFIVVSFLFNNTFPTARLYSLYTFWFSFLLLEFLLVQGSLYWYVKWKRLKSENTSVTPLRMVHRLKSLKKWNIGLISAGPVMFILDFLQWHPSLPVIGLSISAFIYIFAILEFINYFYIQLSYDNRSDIKYLINTKRLKRACIRRDFERIKKGSKLKK